VLFLDEFPEFPRTVLDTLRQPIETGTVMVARANAHIRYPCRFLLIAAANPCKCGYLSDPSLSRYSKVDAYGLTDLGLGFGTQNRSFEVSLLVKNAFNVDHGYQPDGKLSVPSPPRGVGPAPTRPGGGRALGRPEVGGSWDRQGGKFSGAAGAADMDRKYLHKLARKHGVHPAQGDGDDE